MTGRGSNLRVLVIGLLVSGVGVFLFIRSNRSGSQGLRTVPVPQASAGHRVADLRLMISFNCYEHGLENVPPRWDTSGRERIWTAPPPPLPFLRETLNGSEPRLLSWMELWQTDAEKGIASSATDLSELEGLLKETSLPFDTLFKIGLAMSFLDNDAHAACWFRAAIRKAEEEYASIPAGDERAKPLLEALPQMAALWRVRDHATLERRFALEYRLYPPLSAQSRRAGHLLAETVYNQGYYAQAADILMAIQAQNAAAGDLGRVDGSDTCEMNRMVGLLLHSAQRHEAASDYLRKAGDPNCEHARSAKRLLPFNLLLAGHVDEAEQAYQQLKRDDPAYRHLEVIEARISEAKAMRQEPDWQAYRERLRQTLGSQSIR